MDPLIKNHVTVLGPADAERTMVFVHGFGTDQTAWREVQAAFTAGCRIVLLDNVGGGSTPPEAFVQHHYLNLHRYAADLLDVCEALQIRNAVLVGHSVGAMISVLASLRQPERFSRLVLIGASPRYLNDTDYHGGFSKEDLNGLYSAMETSYAEWADQFAPAVMRNADRPGLSQHFAASIKSIPQERALTVLYSIFQSDHRADVKKVRHPTLLIHANEDLAVPLGVAHYLHQSIAGSQLAVVDATGHLPHISAPAAVVQAMQGFVAA
ncbi:alpha/beta hydrolase [Rhodoferax saidenbachensis]|uniref:Alpha/beta hydrolase n=1 Tax=Rhodoferax saidenbachensis TaxID=1484693 RepID=A0A1P8KFK7_9BURK|nr:alpha/beta hydrolase [Rhodoferax saidenbachensis]